MEITYQDAVDGLTAFINSKNFERNLSLSISGDLKAPDAIESVKMLEQMDDFEAKLNFVHRMLKDLGVTVKKGDETLVTFQVTEGMHIEDVEYFTKRPGVLKFTVEAVFSVFLKNLYPLSSESQKAGV